MSFIWRRAAIGITAWTLACAMLALPTALTAQQQQQQMDDVVYMKNRSVLRGVIIEQKPNEYVLLRTADGSVLRLDVGEIDRIAKEAPVGPRPTPVSATTQGVQPAVPVQQKSAASALALSFLINGGGQFYNGEPAKGVLHFVVGLGFLATMFAGYEDCWEGYGYEGFDCSTYTIGAVGLVGTKIWSMWDAYASAQRINRGAQVGSLTIGTGRFALSLVPVPAAGRSTPAAALVLAHRPAR